MLAGGVGESTAGQLWRQCLGAKLVGQAERQSGGGNERTFRWALKNHERTRTFAGASVWTCRLQFVSATTFRSNGFLSAHSPLRLRATALLEPEKTRLCRRRTRLAGLRGCGHWGVAITAPDNQKGKVGVFEPPTNPITVKAQSAART